jgi:hypothetical protein
MEEIGSYCDLVLNINKCFARNTGRKPREPSIRITSLGAEIGTRNFLNEKQEYHPFYRDVQLVILLLITVYNN